MLLVLLCGRSGGDVLLRLAMYEYRVEGQFCERTYIAAEDKGQTGRFFAMTGDVGLGAIEVGAGPRFVVVQ